jgi:hypothetical protein
MFILTSASMISTSKVIDKSNSIISNEEIWNGDKSPDDSNNFIENFNDMKEKKKKSHFSLKQEKKPKHLTV